MADLTGWRRFAHLYRRAGIGATPSELDAAISRDPDENTAFSLAVDDLLNYEAVTEVEDRFQPDPAVPDTLIRWWLERMVRTRRPLLEKMVLFWHNHFATALNKNGMDVPKMRRQNEFFRSNALGPFQSMLNGISRDPAMIVWLDLNSNRKASPNENYARELMELFALGIGEPADPNYTETDIKQATKAFTGYTIGPDGEFLLNLGQHDSTVKTVLGQDCESGDDVNRILVSYRKGGRGGPLVCAQFVSAKLFSFFAYDVTPSDPVVARFASVFEASGGSIRAVVDAILKSSEFSSFAAYQRGAKSPARTVLTPSGFAGFASPAAYRARIKSPVEVAAGALRILGAERVPTGGVLNRLVEQGQRLFYPPNVGGWPSGRGWINATTVLSRSNMAASILNSLGKPADTEAGGAPVTDWLQGVTTSADRVDLVLALLVDGDVPPPTRDALIAYTDTADTSEKLRGLFNLVMAQPAYQLN